MLRPLPGSSGSHSEQTPVSKPAAAIAGINRQDRGCTVGRALVITVSNVRPTAAASGARANARNTNRYDTSARGHCTACSKWVTGAATATARLEVISATPSTRGCHVPIRIRAANTAPPKGTAYTAPRPAPAAHASRMSRSRAVNANFELPRSPHDAAS